jgi:hypothetical protein
MNQPGRCPVLDECAACGRPVVDTDDLDNPLRRVTQAGGLTAYALCGRCLDLAIRDAERDGMAGECNLCPGCGAPRRSRAADCGACGASRGPGKPCRCGACPGAAGEP